MGGHLGIGLYEVKVFQTVVLPSLGGVPVVRIMKFTLLFAQIALTFIFIHAHLSCSLSLNSLKERYIRDYIGEYYGAKWDTRSLDNGSSGVARSIAIDLAVLSLLAFWRVVENQGMWVRGLL